jgi:PHD/YefM family antitoxin component YafN of YafNO toxin-antitoxin module
MDNKGGRMKVTSTEFQQNVGRYQDAAQQAPVAITKNGRTHTVLVSAAFFEMVMKGRVARRVEDLDDETVKAIAGSSVSPEYSHLDDLIKDWTP